MFDIVYADPPWAYYGSATKNAAAGKHYNLMSLDKIKELPVKDIMSKDAALFLWATTPRLPDAVHTIESWGLHYRGIAHVWVKTRKDGAIIHGQGVPPTYSKPTTELLLLATTKPRGRPLKLHHNAIPQVVLAPRAAHSQKPDKFRAWMEQGYHGDNKLELFARHNTPGWICVGEELTNEDIFTSLYRLKNGT